MFSFTIEIDLQFIEFPVSMVLELLSANAECQFTFSESISDGSEVK